LNVYSVMRSVSSAMKLRKRKEHLLRLKESNKKLQRASISVKLKILK
jgi:hypothetical protein